MMGAVTRALSLRVRESVLSLLMLVLRGPWGRGWCAGVQGHTSGGDSGEGMDPARISSIRQGKQECKAAASGLCVLHVSYVSGSQLLFLRL